MTVKHLEWADTFTCPKCERVLDGFEGKDIAIIGEVVEGVPKAVVVCKGCFNDRQREQPTWVN